jgi:hypothetical protein
MPTQMNLRALCVALLSVVFVSSGVHAGILAPGDSFRGRTYQEWDVVWQQRYFATPVVNGDHPGFSGGSLEEDRGVQLLTGVGSGAIVNLTASADTAFFFPILNIESSVFEDPPFHGTDEASLRANSNGLLDQASGLFAVIDGVSVDVLPYRIESPLFQWGPLPQDNLFSFFGLNAPAGTTSPAVDAGYYLLITPLAVGMHSFHFGGRVDSLGGVIDTTYVINVVPEPASYAMLGIGLVGVLGYKWRRRSAA